MNNNNNILITGGAGFIGSNFIKYMIKKYPDYKIINYDKLTYAGNLENLSDVESEMNYTFIRGDITNSELLDYVFLTHNINIVVNFAAESHVDRSILSSSEFIETNVRGTQVLLDVAKARGVDKFLQISTDEVYGSLGETGFFTEDTPLSPNSPYSASKTSADLLCQAYHHTFSMPILITRSSNNYGPYQFPEKLIPLMIKNAREDKTLPVYGDGKNVRDWIQVEDNCSGIDAVLHKGKIGEVYNIGGGNEIQNIEVVKTILRELGKPESLISFVKDRPGHDKRYALDTNKIKTELSWKPKWSFDKGLRETVEWYINNKNWVDKCITGEYLEYYKKNYGN